jgi:hypothetical protein
MKPLFFLEIYMNLNSFNAAEGDRTPKSSRTAPDWSRMALEQIPLFRHANGGFGFKPGGYSVTEATMRTAWKQFWRGVDQLDKSGVHKAQGLACTSDWDNRPPGWRRAMGRCYKYFAVHGVLPITIANPEAKYNFKYRLNGDLDKEPTVH